jgi:hypothetical protein
MDELDHLGWVVWRSYEIGRMQFGIRTNSEACGEWLDETFSEYRVDEETAPYLSLLVAGDENGQVGKRFHVLYEESRALVRTHDLRLVGEMLLAQFDHVQASERTDKVYIDGGLVRLGDVVGLVPPILPPYLGTLGHRVIERAGLELPVSGFVAVDPESGRVVSPQRALDVPADALDRLTEIHPTNGRERRVTVEEPIDVDVVSFIGLSEEPVRTYSPGRAAHILATRTLNIDPLGGAALEGIARLVEKARCYEIQSSRPKTTLEALVQALQPV